MPSDDAKFEVKPSVYRKYLMVEHVMCPKCKEGFMERDKDDARFVFQDRFRSRNDRVYVHECSKCKHQMSLDSCYPKEFYELSLVDKKGSDITK